MFPQQQRQELEAQKEMLDSVSSELSKARKEMEEMKQKETERLETLEAKVKEALYAKDQTIQRLKDELSASNTKVRNYDYIFTEKDMGKSWVWETRIQDPIHETNYTSIVVAC